MTEPIRSYKDLDVYKKALNLCVETYKLTSCFPREEVYGITAQMRRASVSVPSNIAEGYRRGSRREYIQYLHIAHGSLAELETQLAISAALGFIKPQSHSEIDSACEAVSKMLFALVRKLST